MKIRLKSKKYTWNFEIYGKYNIIAGNSGTGKSRFAGAALEAEANNTRFKMSCDVPFHVVTKAELDISRYDGCLLIIDEFCSILKERDFSSIVKDTDCYFLIISRKELNYLPVSIDNYYDLVMKNNVYTLQPHFPRFKNMEFRGITTIVTEDSVSGKQFFEEHFSNLKILSASSKSKIVKFLQENDISLSETIIVYDASAFAYEMGSLLSFLNHSFSNILDWESFENYVLQCEPFNIVLTQKDCDCYVESLEQFSTSYLKEVIAYSKNSLPKCLCKDCQCSSCNNKNKCQYAFKGFKNKIVIHKRNDISKIDAFGGM